jgi:hypothetical protein
MTSGLSGGRPGPSPVPPGGPAGRYLTNPGGGIGHLARLLLICPELSGQRIWVNSRCELPFYVFLVRLSRAPVLKPGVPTL